MGPDLAKPTPHAAGSTLLPSAVSRSPCICGRQTGKLWAPAGDRERAKLEKRSSCSVPCQWPCACHRLASSSSGPQQTTAVLDLPLVSACLFKFSGRAMLSQRAGKPVCGSPPEGVSSLWALAGDVPKKPESSSLPSLQVSISK